ncbi:hypothetical protein BH10CHL1_BH10CHL1_28370 [soil metagenome]
MFYTNAKDLPRTLQETLSVGAQAVYLATYNRVWDEQIAIEHNAPKRSRIAHQMAWDAVNREFTLVKQDDGASQWYRKGEEPVQGQVGSTKKKGFFARLGFA